jgi:hypothetical protein
MLKPIDTLTKRACYVNMGSRAALVIAHKLIDRDRNKNKPIQVGYLQKIADMRDWAKYFRHMPLRFLPQLDGPNITELMKLRQPEKLLWNYMKYI